MGTIGRAGLPDFDGRPARRGTRVAASKPASASVKRARSVSPSRVVPDFEVVGRGVRLTAAILRIPG